MDTGIICADCGDTGCLYRDEDKRWHQTCKETKGLKTSKQKDDITGGKAK